MGRRNDMRARKEPTLSRRRFLATSAGLTGGLLGRLESPFRVTSAAAASKGGPNHYVPQPPPAQYAFRVGPTILNPDGKQNVSGITVNGTYPGPEIRIKEGAQLRIIVANALDQPTTLHWHGILLPAAMDGVPDVSNVPIAPGRIYDYEYPVRQSGTYWYHSHYDLQEQVGQAGPLVIEAQDEPHIAERDAVVMLGDWTYTNPNVIFAKLRGEPGAMGNTSAKAGEKMAGMGDAGAKAGDDAGKMAGMGTKTGDTGEKMAAMGGGSGQADLSDVRYDAFLLNGRALDDPWTFSAEPHERIRLRIINGGASTYFRVGVDSVPLRVTHADGLAVQPVEVDHLLMGMGETYDVVIQLPAPGSYTLHGVAMDGSGQALGILHTPKVKPVANTKMPAFAGRELSYAMLQAPAPTTLPAGDVRPFTIELGGDMVKYIWTLNGQAYPKADPFLIKQGERVALELVNRTMMWHPMHLHGHYFRVLQGAGERAPLKHTANVAPGETVRIEFTTDNPGQWFFHCHNLYHLEAGMARVFEYTT
jgi:multicopper oxidase